MDLEPFTARGFPGNWDALLTDIPVGGIDCEQSQSAVRLCPETESYLYQGGYSPTRIRYRDGSRPKLEAVAAGLGGTTPRAKAEAAMAWVSDRVAHPHLTGPLAPDRALTEEQLIESCRGWCNEQTRVFVALCEVMDIPARLCFLFHANNVCAHTAAEAYVDGRWAFFDVTMNVRVELPDGRLAEGRELSGPHRDLAHRAYRGPLEQYFARVLPFADDGPGWNRNDRPATDRGGDLLACIGITNYLIDGVEAA